MRTQHHILRNMLLLSALWAFVLVGESQAQTVVIVHQSVSVKNLSGKELMDIYTLNLTRWESGARINVFDLKAGRAKDAFHEHIGMSEEELKKIWLRKQFTGKARPPRSIPTEEEIVDLVSQTEGAIGYVNERAIRNGKTVRIVARIK